VSRRIIGGPTGTTVVKPRATTAAYHGANGVNWRVSRRIIGGATATIVVSPHATTPSYHGASATNWRGNNGTIGATGKAVIAAEIVPRSRGIFLVASAVNWPASNETIVVNPPAATGIYHVASVVN
jgi:hypothetical protein